MKSIKNLSLLLLSICSLTTLAKTIETNQIQVLLDPEATWNVFAANIGGSITDDPTVTLPAGATFIQNGLIFRKGTVNLNQSDYRVDRHGQPLTELNSIGVWNSNNTSLVEFDPSNPPMLGTTTAQSTSSFSFHSSVNNPNQIFTIGNEQLINNANPGVPTTETAMSIIGGTGKNHSLVGGNARAELFVAPDGKSSIMVVTFDRKIKINV